MPPWLKWVVLAVVVYFGITEGLPWLQERLSSKSGGGPVATTSDRASTCVSTARRASDAFAGEARRFASPPIDAAAWSQAEVGLRSALGEARAECACAEESCRVASQALTQIDGMITSLDTATRGGPPPLDLAAHMNETDDLLNRAQNLARSGK